MTTDRLHALRRALGEYLALLLVVVLIVVVFSRLSRHFLSVDTFRTLANNAADLAVVSIGMTLVLVAGGIDLSIGSVMALSSSVMAWGCTRAGLPLPLAVAAGLGSGALCGLASGAIAARWAIPSFIVTLGMLEAARGLAFQVTGMSTIYLGGRLEPLVAPLPGLGIAPAPLVVLALAVAAQLALTRTVFGRHLVAVGTNEEAVRLSGIDPRPVRIAVFALSGLAAGLGGLFATARLSSADPNGAVGMELSAIAAAVIGGTSLSGGRGSVIGTLLGVAVIALLQAGLSSIGAPDSVKRIITGGVIVAAVVADAYRSRGLRWPWARRRPTAG
jgi:ribose transport system permease protein